VRVDGPAAVERREPPGRDEHWYLADQREFLLRSLEDADREHDAGDLSDEDHALLVSRDRARLAEVEAQLAALAEASAPAEAAPPAEASAPAQAEPGAPGPEAPAAQPEMPMPEAAPREQQAVGENGTGAPARRPLPLWRKGGIVVCCMLIVLGAAILVMHFVQARQPGQPLTGSISLPQAQQIEQQLQQALSYNNQGNTKAALELYDKVLSEDPSNPAALAYAGYLQWNLGSTAHVSSLVRIGRAEIQTAVKDSPSYYEAHLFYGLVLANQDHNSAAAVVQFSEFLADGPPASDLAEAAPLVAPAYKALGQPLPAQFSTSSTTTTTTTTTPAGRSRP
jgi:tetratricopeptide (TPR) repeat protein